MRRKKRSHQFLSPDPAETHCLRVVGWPSGEPRSGHHLRPRLLQFEHPGLPQYQGLHHTGLLLLLLPRLLLLFLLCLQCLQSQSPPLPTQTPQPPLPTQTPEPKRPRAQASQAPVPDARAPVSSVPGFPILVAPVPGATVPVPGTASPSESGSPQLPQPLVLQSMPSLTLQSQPPLVLQHRPLPLTTSSKPWLRRRVVVSSPPKRLPVTRQTICPIPTAHQPSRQTLRPCSAVHSGRPPDPWSLSSLLPGPCLPACHALDPLHPPYVDLFGLVWAVWDPALRGGGL